MKRKRTTLWSSGCIQRGPHRRCRTASCKSGKDDLHRSPCDEYRILRNQSRRAGCKLCLRGAVRTSGGRKDLRAVRRGAVHRYCDRFRRIPVQQHLSAHDAGCGRSDGKGSSVYQNHRGCILQENIRTEPDYGTHADRAVMLLDKQCIVGIVRKKVMDFYGLTSGDMDGIVIQLKNTEGVHVAIFLYELEPQVFKVSLRSDELVDVSKIAAVFGGGGISVRLAARCQVLRMM